MTNCELYLRELEDKYNVNARDMYQRVKAEKNAQELTSQLQDQLRECE